MLLSPKASDVRPTDYLKVKTCSSPVVDLSSMFQQSSHDTHVVRWCSIASHIPIDSPCIVLQTTTN